MSSYSIERKEVYSKVWVKAIVLLEKSFEQFTKKHLSKTYQKHNISEEQLKGAITRNWALKPLKPWLAIIPGNNELWNMRSTRIYTPFENTFEGNWSYPYGRNAPGTSLFQRVQQYCYKGTKDSKEKSKSQKDTVMFIKQKLDSAKLVYRCLFRTTASKPLTLPWTNSWNIKKEYFPTGGWTQTATMILKGYSWRVSAWMFRRFSRVANSKYVVLLMHKADKGLFFRIHENDQEEDVST